MQNNEEQMMTQITLIRTDIIIIIGCLMLIIITENSYTVLT